MITQVVQDFFRQEQVIGGRSLRCWKRGQGEEGCEQTLRGFNRLVFGMGKTARRGAWVRWVVQSASSQRSVNAQSTLSQRSVNATVNATEMLAGP